MQKRQKNEKCCYVLVAGDRGLAGGYNANLFRCFEADAKGKEICVVPVGKKAVEYAKSRKLEILTDSFAEIANLSVADSFEIARALCREFRERDLRTCGALLHKIRVDAVADAGFRADPASD
mgnify:CR=1 FL=1